MKVTFVCVAVITISPPLPALGSEKLCVPVVIPAEGVNGSSTMVTVGAVIVTAPEFPSVSKESVEIVECSKERWSLPLTSLRRHLLLLA